MKSLKVIGIIISDKNKNDFEILVLEKFKRTIKLLFSINKGLPIINCKWIEQCLKQKKIVDYNVFQFNDNEAETQFGFSLKKSLDISFNKIPKGVFFGFSFWMPQGDEECREDIKIVVTSGGGVWYEQNPKTKGENYYEIIAAKNVKENGNNEFKNRYCSKEDIYQSSLEQNTVCIGKLTVNRNK